MIVFVAGMPRSGSTFTFNIARELLLQRGSVAQVPAESVITSLSRVGRADHLIFKGHGADETTLDLIRFGAIKVICSTRRPEDAIASWVDTFGFSLEESISVMDRWFSMYELIKDNALLIDYDEIEIDPMYVAHRIAEFLSLPVGEASDICRRYTKDKVLEISKRVERGEGDIEYGGFSYYDRETFFHRRHVQSVKPIRSENRLSAAELDLLRGRWRFDRHEPVEALA